MKTFNISPTYIDSVTYSVRAFEFAIKKNDIIFNDTNDEFFMAIHNRQRLIFALRNRASQVFTFHPMFFQIVLDTLQNLFNYSRANTFNLRLAAATLSTMADSNKFVALWTIRENDHKVTETRRIF